MTTPIRRPDAWLVTDLQAADYSAWVGLHRGYLDFYEVTAPEPTSQIVWGWLTDDTHQLNGIVARADAASPPVALAHYRPFPRPLHGSTGLFLDDLFVAPAARGTGAVDALLAELQRRARDAGCDVVRWITRESNLRAQSTYNRLAGRTDLITYDLAPGI